MRLECNKQQSIALSNREEMKPSQNKTPPICGQSFLSLSLSAWSWSTMIKARGKEKKKVRKRNEKTQTNANPNLSQTQENTARHQSIKAPVPVAPHTLPSTRAPVRNRRHAPGAASVGTEINPSNLPAQSSVLVVVVGSRFALVAADFAAGHAGRSLVETARVFLGVWVRDGSDGSRRRRVEVGTFAQGLG